MCAEEKPCTDHVTGGGNFTMWSAIVSPFLGVIGGVVGWVITKLALEPFKEIHDLRREAQECLIVYGNLSKDAPPDDRRAAVEAFRRVGAGLVSRYIASNRAVRWWCNTLQHWDVHSAGIMLLGIADDIQSKGFSFANLSPTVMLVRKCLELPTLGKPPTIHALEENVDRSGIIKPGDLSL